MHPEWRAEGLTLLTPSDRRITERFLLERPAENAYLLAQIKRGALEREDLAGPLVGFWSGGLLRGVCILGSNLLISSPASEAAIDGFAEYTRRLMVPFWVAVGPDAIVQRFLERYGRETRTIRLERGGQMLYEVRTERLIATEPWAPRMPQAESPASSVPRTEEHRLLTREKLPGPSPGGRGRGSTGPRRCGSRPAHNPP